MEKVQEFKDELQGRVTPESISDTAPASEILSAIFPSSPRLEDERPPIGEKKIESLAEVTEDHGDRKKIDVKKLEATITEAVRGSGPGCESFIGVIVRRTTPESHFDPDWTMKGVRFGRADREKAGKALSMIVERMQGEFKLAED
jgi:hypothetical protein